MATCTAMQDAEDYNKTPFSLLEAQHDLRLQFSGV